MKNFWLDRNPIYTGTGFVAATSGHHVSASGHQFIMDPPYQTTLRFAPDQIHYFTIDTNGVMAEPYKILEENNE